MDVRFVGRTYKIHTYIHTYIHTCIATGDIQLVNVGLAQARCNKEGSI